MSDVVTTAGGCKVARGNGSAWLAAQVRSLVSRGYPAFVRRSGDPVEFLRVGGRWSANAPEGAPPWVADLVAVLNETEEKMT